jgi:DNA (cytosine-5)-methyltransferase 3A
MKNKLKEYNVLSLFNGMSCGFMALDNLGYKKINYYVSEIDRQANKAAKIINPNTIFLGDVVMLRRVICWSDTVINKALASAYLSQGTKDKIKALLFVRNVKFDLILAGSPCQGFSFAGKQLNFDDPRSKLFFDFAKILDKLKKVNPEVNFLLENVRMKQESAFIISNILKVMPIKINSALLSAQNRARLYWVNFGPQFQKAMFQPISSAIEQPKDKGILLNDVLENNVSDKYYLSDKGIKTVTNETRLKKRFSAINGVKSLCLLASGTNNLSGTHIDENKLTICAAMRGRYDDNGDIKQEIEVRKDNKTNCLTSVQKDNYLIVPEATKKGYTEIKDGECVDLTFIDSKTRRGRKMDKKSNCLTASNYDFCQWKDAKIRRLTPLECMRLQTIPAKYSDLLLKSNISDSQHYKMAGNGWTVEVISYLLSHI